VSSIFTFVLTANVDFIISPPVLMLLVNNYFFNRNER